MFRHVGFRTVHRMVMRVGTKSSVRMARARAAAQIVQHAADRSVLRVLAAPRFSNADAERLMRNAQKKAPFRAHR
jgi:hypothetical protein